MRALPLLCLGPTPRPAPGCWRHCLQVPHIAANYQRFVARAAATETSGEWVRLSSTDDPTAAGGAAAGEPLQLDDATLVASSELQELARQQLQLLAVSLQLSLQAVLSSSISIDDSSIDEEALRQQLLADSTCLRSTVYCRAPASLQTGQLQLQLVAALGGGSQDLQQQQQQQQQRFLFLGHQGVPGSSLAEQEQWILEQPVIVLPDSGGLVLPLSHNGFLVGLLVVERCLEEEEEQQQQPAAAAGGAAAGAGMPPPTTCLLLRSAELQLLKQTAAVLALACAMDLRAAMERVGAAYRQRQASALVQAAKKPLSVMRTLGTMLLPRLQPGEPDRDFAQGILEQGSRLQEVVSQLQAALHPSAAAAIMPPALLQAGTMNGKRQRKALPRGSGGRGSLSGVSGGGGSSLGQWQLAEPAQGRPALPSSSIGGDYQRGSTIDLSVDEPSATASPSVPRSSNDSSSSSSSGGGSSSSSNSSSQSSAAGAASSSRNGSNGSSGRDGGGMAGSASRASADLLNVLMPLLASASNFAAVSGVSFVMAEHGSGAAAARAGPRAGAGPSPDPQQQLVLPAAEVAVGPGSLKRMLSQLVDGVLACATRGDLVQACVQLQPWEGRPGVAITLCCCYGLAHGGGAAGASQGGGGSAAVASLSRPPMQPEFAFLQSTASEAGGFFEVHSDATPDVQHLNSSALMACLWLPTVSCDAGWN